MANGIARTWYTEQSIDTKGSAWFFVCQKIKKLKVRSDIAIKYLVL
jgi:hypothetical protein